MDARQLGTFNTMMQTGASFGGDFPVWSRVDKVYQGGGYLDLTKFKPGDVIHAGTMVKFNGAGKQVQVITAEGVAGIKEVDKLTVTGGCTSDGNVSIDLNSYTTFLYDEITGGYNQTEGEYMFELGYDTNGHQVVVMEGYSNMVLGAATPVGINNVTTSTDKEAVATEYYDLSGRRVSAAEKGITIKVEKYADGTSKATKVMK